MRLCTHPHHRLKHAVVMHALHRREEGYGDLHRLLQ